MKPEIPPIKALIFMKERSERVPHKNIRPLCGRPLFHWILDTLTASGHIAEIIINTDSRAIADDAASHFDVTIHTRPPHLLDIRSNEASQIIEYDLSRTSGDWFLQTHSTNPLLTTATLDRAIEKFFVQDSHDSLFSVTPLQTRFYFADGRPVNHDPDHLIPTQELPPLYEENSCIYLFSRDVFDRHRVRFGTSPLLFPIDRREAVDIDEPYDFDVAEALMAARLKREA